ncbi:MULTISPECIES: hypothetical protein [Bacillus cereus group]|uniref:hypothetical protein n=1 Tax=Bacillus cereus group TaxID=86661 RepID=UPI0002791CE0|nr:MULTISPECIES: hypothetical protein [Bacillus cereus group]EJQ02902.1 hypothetical protein IC5_03072 [Bacillus cereus AND1407]KMP85865.1 hypothetical protein TU64_09580 [Bacillus cereus]MDG0911042.1 hypothetical protein [Bacillus paranthracis]MDR4349691.1 hypothetical protein [Bacillus paranthracis]PER83805.1 hypothetical protein CN487_05060 [Bacillus cereus]
MGLLFKNSVEKADNIIAKYEAKRKELQGKIVQLNEDARFLQSEIENDFQKAIMEDGKPNEKLKTSLNKVCEERKQVQKVLGNMDNLLGKALEGIREEVETDREKVFKKAMQEQEDMATKLKDAKLAYLKLLVEYSDAAGNVDRELTKFGQIEQRLELEPIPHYKRRTFEFNVNRNYDNTFHPIITTEDSKGAFGGRLGYYAIQYEGQTK